MKTDACDYNDSYEYSLIRLYRNELRDFFLANGMFSKEVLEKTDNFFPSFFPDQHGFGIRDRTFPAPDPDCVLVYEAVAHIFEKRLALAERIKSNSQEVH